MQPPEQKQPFWARVITCEHWDGDGVDARRLLDALSGQWPNGIRSRVLLLCGGFVEFAWPREEIRQLGLNGLRDAVRDQRPEIAIHYPHTADTPRTWGSSWQRLLRPVPSIEYYAASGRFYNDGHHCRGSLDDVIDSTIRGPSITFVLNKVEPQGKEAGAALTSPG